MAERDTDTRDLSTLLAELRATLAAATPGPWVAETGRVFAPIAILARCYGPDDIVNARAIATLRNVADALIAAVDAAQDRAECTEYCQTMCEATTRGCRCGGERQRTALAALTVALRAAMPGAM